MVISKRWILISTTIQSIPLVKLIAIPSISNPALVSTVPSWTTNIIQSKYIDRDCIHNNHNDLQHAHNYIIYQNHQFHSLLLMPSKTNVVETADKDLSFHIFHICYFIIFHTRNCWIDFNTVGFDAIYPLFWFWSDQINFFFLSTDVGFWLAPFVVAVSYQDICLWWWFNHISISEGIFLFSFTWSLFHLLAFSTLVFCSLYILTTLGTASCVTGIIGKLVTSCLFLLLLFFFLKLKSFWFF